MKERPWAWHSLIWGMRYLIPTLVLVTLIATGCVSKRKYVTATNTADRLRADSSAMAAEDHALRTQLYGLQDYAKLTADELEQRKSDWSARTELKKWGRAYDEWTDS